MRNALSVSQARSKLGRLLDQAARGKPVYIRRGEHRLCIDLVAEREPIPMRPFGYFKFDDELTAFADRGLISRYDQPSVQ